MVALKDIPWSRSLSREWSSNYKMVIGIMWVSPLSLINYLLN